jgi:hypothetical protein
MQRFADRMVFTAGTAHRLWIADTFGCPFPETVLYQPVFK